MESQENKVTIKIPRPLYNRLNKIVEGSGFNSVTDFIVYVLRDIVSSNMTSDENQLTKEELEAHKKKFGCSE